MPGRFYDLVISLSTATRKKGIINIIAIARTVIVRHVLFQKIEKSRLEHASYAVNVLKNYETPFIGSECVKHEACENIRRNANQLTNHAIGSPYSNFVRVFNVTLLLEKSYFG